MFVGNVTGFNSTYSRVGNKLHVSMTKLLEKMSGGITTSNFFTESVGSMEQFGKQWHSIILSTLNLTLPASDRK